MSMTYEQAVAIVTADQRESFTPDELPDDEVVAHVRNTIIVDELNHNSTYDAYKIVLEADPRVIKHKNYVRATETHEFGSDHINYCPECDQYIERSEDDGSHTFNANDVMVVGCTGYWLHDPAMFGLDRGQWEDWK